METGKCCDTGYYSSVYLRTIVWHLGSLGQTALDATPPYEDIQSWIIPNVTTLSTPINYAWDPATTLNVLKLI